MTAMDVAMPGLCGCGRYRSLAHSCEFRPTPMRLCECGEWTYAAECGGECRLPEPPPWPATTLRVPILVDCDVAWLAEQTMLADRIAVAP